MWTNGIARKGYTKQKDISIIILWELDKTNIYCISFFLTPTPPTLTSRSVKYQLWPLSLFFGILIYSLCFLFDKCFSMNNISTVTDQFNTEKIQDEIDKLLTN